MPFNEGAVDHQCERFNEAVVAEIERLAHAGLKGVVIAGRWPAYLGRPSPDGSLLARLSYGEEALDSSRSRKRRCIPDWRTRWIGWSARGCGSSCVGATPEFQYSVPQCLLRRPLHECSMPRAAVDERRERAMQVVASTVASDGGAHMFDPLRFFCDDDFCYPTHGRTVMFSDPQHLTTAGSQLLVPELAGDLRWLLQGAATGREIASRDGSIPNI